MRFVLFFFLFVVFCGCSSGNVKNQTITWASGKDVTGVQRELLERFMAVNPGITVRLIEMPESSSAQRDSYVTYLIARDPTIDVYTLDTTWTAEFAAAGWILPLDSFLPAGKQKIFLEGPLAACIWQGRLFAVPWFTDAGILYYRSDLLAGADFKPPRTWSDLVYQASALGQRKKIAGYVFQGAQYEGLICNYLEILHAYGGDILDDHGNPALDTAPAREALKFMNDMIAVTRVAPRSVLAYKEEESRQDFTSGQSVFMRNWPYAWQIAQDKKKSMVYGRTGIAPLPGRHGRPGIATLGGWNIAISRFSRHPALAWRFAAFMVSPEAQKRYALGGGRLPTREDVYADRELLRAAPHYAALHRALLSARPRPMSPRYAAISDILQVELHRALTGRQSIDTALKKADDDIRRLNR